jgi:hypothetical protein
MNATEATLVLEEQPYASPWWKPGSNQRERLREVCLKAACAAGSWLT